MKSKQTKTDLMHQFLDAVGNENYPGKNLKKYNSDLPYDPVETIQKCRQMNYKGKMRISICWLYSITASSYLMDISGVIQCLEKMKRNLSARFVELEGIGKEGMMALMKNKKLVKDKIDELGLTVVNFCPIVKEYRDSRFNIRKSSLPLMEMGIELAKYFNANNPPIPPFTKGEQERILPFTKGGKYPLNPPFYKGGYGGISITVQTDSFLPYTEHFGTVPYAKDVEYDYRSYRSIPPFKYNPDKEFKNLTDSLVYCVDAASKEGINFLIEPRKCEIISDTGDLLRIVEEVNSRINHSSPISSHRRGEDKGEGELGVVFDTGHLNFGNKNLLRDLVRLSKYVKYIHLSDNDGKSNDHLMIGDERLINEEKGAQGIMWLEFFRILKEINYSGCLGIDIGGKSVINPEGKQKISNSEKLQNLDNAVKVSIKRIEKYLKLLEIEYEK